MRSVPKLLATVGMEILKILEAVPERKLPNMALARSSQLILLYTGPCPFQPRVQEISEGVAEQIDAQDRKKNAEAGKKR